MPNCQRHDPHLVCFKADDCPEDAPCILYDVEASDDDGFAVGRICKGWDDMVGYIDRMLAEGMVNIRVRRLAE